MTATIRRIVNIPIRENLSADFITFAGLSDALEHIAIGLGHWRGTKNPLVRIHSECLTGDIFGSQKCDCGPQLEEAIFRIAAEGGLIVYLRQEGRGIGLYNKLDAYDLQAKGFDTFEANRLLQFPDDMRDFRCAAEILKALDVHHLRLLSNNPDKVEQLRRNGVEVTQRVGTGIFVNKANKRYLEAKEVKAGHQFQILQIVGRFSK